MMHINPSQLVLIHIRDAHIMVSQLIGVGGGVHLGGDDLGGDMLLELDHGGLMDDHKVDVLAGGALDEAAVGLVVGGGALTGK